MRLRNGLYLCLGALIWGTAFVAQSEGNHYMGPVTFQAARSVLAVLFLLPLVLVRKHARDRRIAEGDRNVPVYSRSKLLLGGLCTGAFLTASSTLQQIGLVGTDVGKSGFLTDLYIVLVPVLAFFLTGKSSLRIWISVLIAALGLYFLCFGGSVEIGRYDLILILCAFFFACQITCVDYFCRFCDGVELSLMQFVTTTVISVILSFMFEKPEIGGILEGWFPLFYAGILSSGVAYTLQIVGQKGQDPTVASLIMSLESVISVISGWLILHQTLSVQEGLGCALMFLATIFAQSPIGRKKAAEAQAR